MISAERESSAGAAADALRGASRIAILGHVNPDADCLGSMGAVRLGLTSIGKSCVLSLPPESVARKLTYLTALGAMHGGTLVEVRACNASLILDTAREKRVNIAGEAAAFAALPPIINVDHHATNTRYGDVNWVDPHRSSTAEMAFELLCALGCAATSDIATLLYAGIHSDTQGFSLASTTPRCLDVAHQLARAGARIAEVGERLHRSQTREEFALHQLIHQNTRISADGRVAWSSASLAEIAATGCDANVIDNQVEIPRSIEGITVAMLFTEGEPGVIRVNFRGEGGTAVLPIAEAFGGGGHVASAGARVRGELGEVIERVVAAASLFPSRDREGAEA
ncbi:Bifunctional oligoribonuclease and PAP phosphatase NrnA [Phycisphaerae bacterium RAS1]|nr:Bifunctional oligoribonuclease and PAP phosphatase NrnA [Phycisphaerae bacterium RAS1]